MLPPSLVSVYQQYKEDTDAVASWLASTAKSRGYPAELLSGASSKDDGSEQSKRLKGKARKQAKAAAEQAKESSSRPDYIIAIKDFIPLAEFVAACQKPFVSVPLSFANTLNRVISARSGFRSKLDDVGDLPDVSADSKHSYFVGVLERVREVLTPRLSPASRDAATPQAPSPSDPVGEVGGRFAGLSVDEPSEKFLNAPDIERPVPVNNDKATYVAEPLQDLLEVLFAYTLLYEDLYKIRARIKWIWMSYHGGHMELVAAAIATNTACDLARNLMGDMAPMFKAHGGAMKAAHLFYVFQCILAGFVPKDIIDSSDDSTYETYEIASDTYMVAFVMLERLLGILDPRYVPVCEGGILGTYDPTRDRSRMSKREAFQQDETLLNEFLTEVGIVARFFTNYPVCDEFIRGIRELDRTREIPMYLAFAAQIFLDIHYILRDKVYSGYETCMSQMRLMDEDLALQLDFHANVPTKKWVAPVDEAIKDIRKKIKWVQDDFIHETTLMAASKMGTSCTAPRHRLLKYSPVIAGLMLYHFRTALYDVGLGLANAWGSINNSVHLYNALKQEKLLSPRDVRSDSWDDIMVALILLGDESFYAVSELPKDPEGYLKQLSLQMGVTATAFSKSKNRRVLTHGRLTSKGSARGLKRDCAPVCDMFYDRYIGNTGQVDWTPEHVDRVLSRALHAEAGEEQDGSLIMGQITDREKLRERKRNITPGAAGKKDAAAGMPPERLIRPLACVLQMESLTMAFPYLALHREAWGILREVRDACEPLLAARYGPAHTIKEDNLPFVVNRIFCSLMDGDDRLFVRASEVVKDQLRRGHGCKTLLRLRSMGFTVAGPRKVGDGLPEPGTFFIM